MKIFEIMKALAKSGINTSMHWDMDTKKHYVNLETGARSHLYLYEDGEILGRWGHKSQLNLDDDMDSIIHDLCWEFKDCLHGKDYYSVAWSNLCFSRGISTRAGIL